MSQPRPVTVQATELSEGCAHCGTQATIQLSPKHGRLCADAVILPPGRFDDDLAADMVAIGRADAAFTYLAAYLSADCDRRFAALAVNR